MAVVTGDVKTSRPAECASAGLPPFTMVGRQPYGRRRPRNEMNCITWNATPKAGANTDKPLTPFKSLFTFLSSDEGNDHS